MPKVVLSKSEKVYIEEGISFNVRTDGRDRLKSRPLSIALGCLPHAYGSAECRIGRTTVLAGVKGEIRTRKNRKDDKVSQYLEVTVRCGPGVTWEEDSGATREQLKLLLESTTSKYLNVAGVIDTKKLQITSIHYWYLYIDVVVIAMNGNLLDATAAGVYASLKDTRLPKVKIVEGVGEEKVPIELGEEEVRLDCSQLPICVSLYRVAGHLIVDPTLEEEICSDCRLTFVISPTGKVVLMEKGGQQGIDPSSLSSALALATEYARQTSGLINQVFEESDVSRMMEMDFIKG